MRKRFIFAKLPQSIVDMRLGYEPGQKVHFRWDWHDACWHIVEV